MDNIKITAYCEKVLTAAKEAGISPAEIATHVTGSFKASVRDGKLEEYQVSDKVRITLRGRFGARIGTAAATGVDEAMIPALIRSVQESAEMIETDEQDEILPPDAHYGEVVCFSEALEAVGAQEKIDRAMEIDRLMHTDDARLKPDSTTVAASSAAVVLQNTLGLHLSHRQNMVYAYTSVLAQDDDRSATGFKLLWGHSMDDIGAKAVAQGCIDDALSKLYAGRTKTQVTPVVIRNGAMADLLSTFSGIFSADNAQQGMSLLAGREGTAIASPCVTLVDDPLLPWGIGSGAFDNEGAATFRKNVIENGVLTTLLHNRKTARKAGCQTTGNAAGGGHVAPSNFFIAPGEKTQDELFAEMSDGLYITEIEGLHAGANAVSGDFSLLSRGFEVKDGRKIRAVEQFTVAGNFYKLLEHITAVGSDLIFEGSSIGCPSVIVSELSVAGE